jgi:hypothetical protein
MNKAQMEQIQKEIIAKAWSDQRFKERLLKNPREILEEYGIHLPPNTKIHVIENHGDDIYFLLPKKIDHSPETDLEKINAAGSGYRLGGY